MVFLTIDIFIFSGSSGKLVLLALLFFVLIISTMKNVKSNKRVRLDLFVFLVHLINYFLVFHFFCIIYTKKIYKEPKKYLLNGNTFYTKYL